jgi:hypothetical protein
MKQHKKGYQQKRGFNAYQYGGVSREGYRSNSPDRFNPYNIIPSGNISMKNVPHPVLGIDDTGLQQMMYPGANYQFPGQAVFEVPMRGFGSNMRYQQGGVAMPPLTKNFVDSTLQANQNLNWVDRYVHPNNYPKIYNPDGSYSTHLMASSDNFAYPTIIQGSDGKLIKLSPQDAYNYAMKTGTFIKFKNEDDAMRFADNGYKVGTQYRKLGGKVKYQQGGQARQVNVVPEGYVFSGEQQGKKYYTKKQASSLPTASSSSDNMGGDKYEKFLIQQLGSGVSPQELAQKKYISSSDIPKYQGYYKPQQDVVYTQPPPPPAPVDNPAQAFSGTYLFDPSQRAIAEVNYASRNSAGQADPGSLNTPQQVAQLMFLDPMGKPDPSKGYYEIPGNVFSNQMTGGTRTLSDTTGISQYKVPRTFQQGGQARQVNTVPEGYVFSGEQQGKKYYTKKQASSLPTASSTSDNMGGDKYEKFLIQQLGSGVSPEELAQKRYITPSDIPKYRGYYKPQQDIVYTQPPPAPAPVDNPARAFSGTYVFDPNNVATGQVNYISRNSAGQADPGSLNTPDQVAQFMFVDKMGKPDPSRGYYEIPGNIFSNQMTGGTQFLRDTTGINQYKVPRTFQFGGGDDDYGKLPFEGTGNPFFSPPPDYSLMGTGTYPLVNKPVNLQPVRTAPAGSVADMFPQLPTVAPSILKPPAPQRQTQWGPNIPAATATVSALSFLGSALESNDRNRYKNLMRLRGMSDSVGPVTPGSRGDYSLNEGYFRPDQYVPVQFGATPVPRAQAGGIFDNPVTSVPQLQAPSEAYQYAGLSASNQDAGMQTEGNQYEDMPATAANTEKQSTVNIPKANIKDAPVNNNARKAYDYYVNQKGLAPQAAAGIVGNLMWESGLKTNAKEQGNTQRGRGIAQWDVDGRWLGFQNWAKKNNRKTNDLYAQLDYVLSEPGESGRALKALMNASTPEEASYVFGKKYERPLDKKDVLPTKNPARWDMRAGIARRLYDEFLPTNDAGNGADNGPGIYAAVQPDNTSQADEQATYQQGGMFRNNFLPFPQRYRTGGEYMVSPSQLQFILAHGGEVEFL